MKEVGTLQELDAKVGDVVECVSGPTFGGEWTVGKRYTMTDKGLPCDRNGAQLSSVSTFRIISRSTSTPKLWRNMTPEEKGALLLAAHEKRDLEYWRRGSGGWASCSYAGIYENEAYRIKPEPKVEVVTLYGGANKWNNRHWGLSVSHLSPDQYKITFNLIDGKPDCASVKMECI